MHRNARRKVNEEKKKGEVMRNETREMSIGEKEGKGTTGTSFFVGLLPAV